MPNTMHPVINRFLVGLISLALMMGLSACAGPQAAVTIPTEQAQAEQVADASADSSKKGKATDTGNSSDGELPGEVGVRFQEEGFEPLRIESPVLGSISFSEDSRTAAELEIRPGKPPVMLQIVDSAGQTWSLKIPEGALESPRMVKMVALSQLDAAVNAPVGKLISGVRLEPDGLTFIKPLSLSVSGSGFQGPTLMLSGSHSGSDIDYSLQDLTAKQPTARIEHFSTYFASQPQADALAEIREQSGKEYQRLAAEARRLLKSPLDIPTPPSIPLECPDDETGQENGENLSKFLENGMNPENDLLMKMLAQRTNLQLVGDENAAGMGDLEQALVGRIGRKATSMMSQFSSQEDKLVAVTEFAVAAARKIALVSGDQAVIQQILSELANWHSKLIDPLIDDIQKNHNYKRIPVVMMIAYKAELAGANNDIGSMIEKLKNALKFEARINFAADLPDVHNITEAVVQLQLDPEKGQLYQCSGAGQGTYLKAEMDDEDGTVATSGYPATVALKEFDPCNGTVMIGFDRFGSDADTITFTIEEISSTGPWTISRDTGISLFSDELEDGMYWFKLQVNNGSATTAEETLERTKFGKVQGELTIELIHK